MTISRGQTSGHKGKLSRDVVIVGGGPVGLATAIALRQHGLSVTVLEAGDGAAALGAAAAADDSAFPLRDKACGEGLMPAGVEALRSLGVDPTPLGHPFAGIRFIDCTSGAAGQLGNPAPAHEQLAPVAEGRFTGPPGLGIRRLDVHGALAERAAMSGVELRAATRAVGLLAGGAGVGVVDRNGDRQELAARFVVGADGLHSAVRGWAGLAREPRRWISGGQRFGVRRHFAVRPWSELVEVYWGDGVEAYVTPVGAVGEDPYVGVAMLWRQRKRATVRTAPDNVSTDAVAITPPRRAEALFDRLCAQFPALADRLAGATTCSRERGCGPLRQSVRRVVKGNLALVGDAAGYVDALTGEGLGLGLASAPLLAAALARGDLASYRAAHRTLVRVPFLLTEALLFAERHPPIRRRLLLALATHPTLFAETLAVLDRARPLGWSLVGRFGRALLARQDHSHLAGEGVAPVSPLLDPPPQEVSR